MRFCCLVLFFSCITTLFGGVDDIIQGEPAVFAEKIAPLLQQFDAAAVDRDVLDPSLSDNATLLSEDVTYIAEDGTIYEVYHRAFTALTESNLRYLAEDVYRFRPDQERLYVVLAETIQPDGQHLVVRSEGIMHQTPQRDADLAIYSGREELKLIFPGVTPGATVHSIVVREKREHRIPGEYTDYWGWSNNWQTLGKRTVLDMPIAVAEELDVFTLGSPVPEREIDAYEAGRVRWIWESDTIPMWQSEENGAGLFQSGPWVYATSIDNWEAFSAWYGGLVADRSTLSDELIALSNEWVGDAQTPEAKLDALFKKAARDVRYTSIDFGHSGLQPQEAQTVWTNKYGDCKDKSNFLRLLLREHGIEAYLTLINTEHSGSIDQRAVDYRHFDHAIVTVVQADGSLVFCDPTIKYGWAGLITPSLAARPALLIDPEEETGRWVQTPASPEDKLTYRFEMELSASGELGGWFELKAVERYAAYFISRFDSQDQVSLKQQVEEYVRYFYPKAQLIDFSLTQVDTFEGEFELRAYLATTLPPANGNGQMGLNWPEVDWLLPRLGADRTIKRDAFLNRDSIVVQYQLVLPEGYQPLAMPRDFRVEAIPFIATAQWRFDAETRILLGEQVHRLDTALIRPSEFPSVFQAVDAASTWLEDSVTLHQAAEGESTVASHSMDASEVHMKLMPTGKGQLRLVDRLYPEGKNDALRREALQQVLQWFPKDVSTRFEVEMRMAWLRYNADEDAEALEMVRRLIRDFGDQVSTQNLGWAYYLEASCLFALEENEASRALYQKLAEDSQYSDFRRAWSYFYWADIISEDAPEQAFELYVSAFNLDSGDELDLLKRINWHAMQADLPDAYRAFLEETIAQYPNFVDSLFTNIASQAESWMTGATNASLAIKLYAVLDEVMVGDASIAEREEFAGLKAYVKSLGEFNAIQSEVSAFLKTEDLGFWDQAALDSETRDAAALAEALSAAVDAHEVDESARIALVRLLSSEPTGEFADWLWQAALYADWREKEHGLLDDGLLELLLGLEAKLPVDSAEQLDLLFLRGLYWQRRDNLEQEYAVYQDLIGRELESAWQDTLLSRAGLNRERANDLAAALSLYESALVHVASDWDLVEQLLRKAYIHLEQGDEQAALKWVEQCLPVLAESDAESASLGVFNDWSNLQESDQLRAHWQIWKQWWNAWELVEDEYADVALVDASSEVAFVADWEDLGLEIGTAIGAEDDAAFFAMMRQSIEVARWDPSGLAEVATLMNVLMTQKPEQADLWKQLLFAIYESIPAGVEEWQTRALLQYALVILNGDEYAPGIAAVDRYLASSPVEDNNFQVLERVGALYAVQGEGSVASWVERMEAQVETLDPEVSVYSANILAQLHRSKAEYELEAESIQVFSDKYPGFKHAVMDQLNTRIAELEQAQKNAEDLERSLQQWLSDVGPVWLQFMPEVDVSHYATQRLAAILDAGEIPGDDAFSRMQFALLAAQDERLGVAEREDALVAMVGTILDTARTTEDALEMLRPFSAESFPLEVRLVALWNALVLATFDHNLAVVDEVLANPQFEQFAERFKAAAEDCRIVAEMDQNQATSVLSAIDVFMQADETHPLTTVILRYSFERLLALGDVDTAEKYLKRVAKSKLGKLPEVNFRAMRLDLMRQSRATRKMLPIHALLADVNAPVLEGRPETAALPEQMPTDMLERAEYFERDVFMSLLKYEWENDCYDHRSLEYWSDWMVQDLSYTLDFDGFYQRLDQLVLPMVRLVEDDATAIEVILFFTRVLDLDDSTVRQLFAQACAELLDQGEFPETEAFIKSVDLGVKIRTVAELHIEKEVESVRHPWAPHFTEDMVVGYYLSRGDTDALGRYLNKLSSESLLSPSMLVRSLEGFKRTGQELEFELAAEDARELLAALMAEALVVPARWRLQQIFAMTALLEDSDVITAEWIDAMRADLPLILSNDFEMFLAHHQKDWEGLVKHVSQILETHPRYYDYYYYLGVGQYHLGQLGPAREALQIFSDRAKDSSHIPEVLGLLNESGVTSLSADVIAPLN